jgi:maleylpyruvate isomerase
MKLYSYFRSSAAYRVRIALNLKGLSYETVPVHLLRHGGEQFSLAYRALNSAALLPTFIDDSIKDGATLSQSLAIIEYLEEVYPAPALLPDDAVNRAYVRSIALSIACDIHPLGNLRVLRYLVQNLSITQEEKETWCRHWCENGLAALETRLAIDDRAGTCCYGDTPTLADCCLIPQMANAQRFHCDLSAFPTLERINRHCLSMDAFIRASPAQQQDAE